MFTKEFNYFQNPFKYIATNILLQQNSHFVSNKSTTSLQFSFDC